MFNLDGQIALVTGGSQGIGRETALTLARLGADVAIMARSADRCEAVASEIRDLGRRAVALPGDMSKSDEIRSVVEKAVSSLGPISILVNNAAITRDGSVQVRSGALSKTQAEPSTGLSQAENMLNLQLPLQPILRPTEVIGF